MNVAVRVAYLSPGRLALAVALALSAVPAHINSQLPTGNYVAGGIGTTHLVAMGILDVDPDGIIA